MGGRIKPNEGEAKSEMGARNVSIINQIYSRDRESCEFRTNMLYMNMNITNTNIYIYIY